MPGLSYPISKSVVTGKKWLICRKRIGNVTTFGKKNQSLICRIPCRSVRIRTHLRAVPSKRGLQCRVCNGTISTGGRDVDCTLFPRTFDDVRNVCSRDPEFATFKKFWTSQHDDGLQTLQCTVQFLECG